ncbi:MAG: universal stress protein UspA [Planctomycetaceae bacterium]|nr:universal stress protein UspA [Planctomycetaceae bacterium]
MSWSPEKIVVPVDFSEETENAVRSALAIVGDASKLHVIHVLFPLDAMSPGVVWGDTDNESRETHVRQAYDEFLAETGISGMNFETRTGDPGLVITDYATEIGAGLIVIPSHGYHGLKRLVLGSVAERVIRHADCSVLVLRRGDAD